MATLDADDLLAIAGLIEASTVLTGISGFVTDQNGREANTMSAAFVVLSGTPTTKRFEVMGPGGRSYTIKVIREADGYLLDHADGTFSSSPATAAGALTADVNVDARYLLDESRAAWNDGHYSFVVIDEENNGVVGAFVELLGDLPVALTAGSGSNTIGAIFNDVQTVLQDSAGNVYSDTLLVAFYNRIQDEIAAILRQQGAEIAMTTGTITGTGTTASFTLPDNFLAVVPNTLMPRSPLTATSNYVHGPALVHVDRQDRRITTSPSMTGSPRYFFLSVSGTTQTLTMDVKPPSGNKYDYLYYSKTVPASVGATLDTTATPWMGLLDPLISRSLEEYCREGTEFTVERRALWRARAEADCMSLLGLRHVQTQSANPSLWKNFPHGS